MSYKEDFEQVKWPGLVITEGAAEQFGLIAEFFDGLKAANHEKADEIINELFKVLKYLNDYGGEVSDRDRRRRFYVHMYKDWADYSFDLRWYSLNLQNGTYQYAWNGGLIWHGGPNDPLSVTLTPQWWGIHT